ncbi:hypothetical protein D3C75_1012250 [compost metagenome]
MANRTTISRAVFGAGAVAVGLVTVPMPSHAFSDAQSGDIVSLAVYRSMKAETPWTKISEKLREWSQLEADWDGDGAAAPSTQAVEFAQSCLCDLRDNGAAAPKATIATDGEIAFEWENGDGYASLSFTDDLHVIAFLREAIDTPPLRIDEPYTQASVLPFLERISAFA